MLPYVCEEKKAGDLYLVFGFVLAASTRKFDLLFVVSCYKA